VEHDIYIGFNFTLTKNGPEWLLNCVGKDFGTYNTTEIRKVVANNQKYLEFIDFIEKYWKNIDLMDQFII